ncbi:MAG: UbiA prenyltransferase family protein [Candidatus Woesearchaeota archaeon]
MFRDIVRLLRIQQWYKNVVVFFAIIFALQFTNVGYVILTMWGFFGLCLVSSANYIVNDILDRDGDRYHPEKNTRPIASGKISVTRAVFIAGLLLVLGFYIGYRLSFMFLVLEIMLFTLTTLYSLYFKKEAIADVLFISTNFTIRAVAGAFITSSSENMLLPAISISPWLILCPFFLALFLALGKRYADLCLLGKSAVKHKEVYKYYTKQNLATYMDVTTALLIICYALFSFFSAHLLLFSIPFALYGIFRYHYFVYNKPEIARKPHKLFADKRMVVTGILWGLTVLVALL